MATNAPLLSIVTPCLNAAAHLPRALESVAGCPSLRGAVEHIVMDGGSTDGGRELIARHAERHPGLVTHWRSGPDGGQSDAINGGLALARGTFGAWLNADDWYEPEGLARAVEALRKDPGIDVLVGRCRFVDEAGRTVFAPRPPEPIRLGQLLRLRTGWFNGRSLVQPEVIFRLDLFRRVGGLDRANHHTMDYDLWLRLLEAGARFEAIDADLACQGVHAGQKTADNAAVVRSIHAVAAAAAERNAHALGPEADHVRAELDAIGRKLRIATPVLALWDRLLAQEGPGETECTPGGQGRAPSRAGSAAELFAPVVAEAGAALRRRFRFRRSLDVLLATRGSAEAAAHLLRQMGRKRLRIAMTQEADGGPAAGVLEHALAGSVAIVSSLPWEQPAATRPTEGVDLVLTEGLFGRSADPARILGSLWRRLRPGGCLLQLPEPRPTTTLVPYLRWLRRGVADRLSTNDDVVLTPAADGPLASFAAGLDAQGWIGAHPGWRGVDLRSLAGGLDPAPEVLLHRAFGSPGFHPAAPFPFVGPPALGRDAAWALTLWRKPR